MTQAFPFPSNVGVTCVALALSGCARCGQEDSPPDDSITESVALDADGDGYTDDQDCDDSDPTVHPDAEEACDGSDNDCNGVIDDLPETEDICDGVDNDCDGRTDEDEMVLFYSQFGDVMNFSDAAMAATAEFPLGLSLDEDGELVLCGGPTLYLTIDVSANVSVLGRTDAPESTVLSAGGSADAVLHVVGAGVSVDVAGVTLSEGEGICASSKGPAGGGVCCEGASVLRISNAIVSNNVAAWGAGIFVDDCNLEIVDSEIRDNESYGWAGGVGVVSGEVLLQRSVVERNLAENGAGGGFALSEAILSIEDSVVSDNSASIGGGVYIGVQGSVTCVGQSASLYGIVNNQARENDGGGGVFMVYDAVGFFGTTCDLGTQSTGSDNTAPDLYCEDEVCSVDIDNDATFTCTTALAGCEFN